MSTSMNPTPPQIQKTVTDLLCEQLGQDEAAITPQAKLSDLGADSLDLVEIVMLTEDEFGIDISNQDAEKITTVQDLLDCIERNLP